MAWSPTPIKNLLGNGLKQVYQCLIVLKNCVTNKTMSMITNAYLSSTNLKTVNRCPLLIVYHILILISWAVFNNLAINHQILSKLSIRNLQVVCLFQFWRSQTSIIWKTKQIFYVLVDCILGKRREVGWWTDLLIICYLPKPVT